MREAYGTGYALYALVVCDVLLFAGCSYIVGARTAEGDSRYSCLQDVCVDPKVVWILSVAGTCNKIKKIYQRIITRNS